MTPPVQPVHINQAPGAKPKNRRSELLGPPDLGHQIRTTHTDAEHLMSDVWAYCDPCGRWFYPVGEGEAQRTPPCPVCATESKTVSDTPAL